jgi:hypothetical protein
VTDRASGAERFGPDDLEALAALVSATWLAAADRDWSRPAAGLDWSCLATADHAVDCVYAPAFFLASRRTDAYPVEGSRLELRDDATPARLVGSLATATRLLLAVVRDAPDSLRAVILGRPLLLGAPPDFPPRAALELALHGNDVAGGLGVEVEPPEGLARRLGEHTRPWPFWGGAWAELGHDDDAWGDLLAASGRARATG